SATRAIPRSSRSSACSTASRTAPSVFGPISSRRSKAASMVLAISSSFPADMEHIPVARFVGARRCDVKRDRLHHVRLGSVLARAIGYDEAEDHGMVTVGIALCAGVFYGLACYKLSFWIL